MIEIWDLLKKRGSFRQCSNENALRQQKEKVVAYVGFDPTADSFHVGHLGPLMCLRQIQIAGGQAIALLGGGTALVGDPTGKQKMRQMLSAEVLAHNEIKLRQQLERFLPVKQKQLPPKILNNTDWLKTFSLIRFLRDIGKHFSVNRMLGLESIKTRIEGAGITFLEFSYPLLQAYDFLHIFQNHQCKVQIGGDDQWTNILGGIDLIRRTTKKQVFGWTLPLLTTSSGQKMGKTERGAVWLDPYKTSPYQYYQYWINLPDADVIKYLKYFTTLPLAEIAKMEKWQGKDIFKAKAVLAKEVTAIAHGKTAATEAEKGTRTLFQTSFKATQLGKSNDKSFKADSISGIPATKITKQHLENGWGLLNALKEIGLASSNSQARRLVEQGGVRVNSTVVKDASRILRAGDLKQGLILLQAGKKRHHQLVLISHQADPS